MKKKQIGISELYALCNKEQLFTCGSVEQYEKMFELAKNSVTQIELTYILYLCSKYRLDIIHNIIAPLFKDEKETGK